MRYCILVFLFFLFVLGGCARQSSVKGFPVEEWLDADPQECMDYYIGRYDSLFANGEYKKLAAELENIFRNMPVQPQGNKDTLRRRITSLLGLHFNVMRKTKQYKYAITLLDSIRLGGESFLSSYCLYPLLAFEAQNSLMTDSNRLSEQFADMFSALPEPEDPSIVMECCHRVSWVYHFCSGKPRADTRMQERAVTAYRQGGNMQEGAGTVLARMGYFYRREGRYEQAVDNLLEATQWYERHPEVPLDGKIRTYGDLAALYSTLELYDEAFKANAHAIQLSISSSNNSQLADMLRIRSALFSERMQVDSAFFYLDKELEVVKPDDDLHIRQYCRDHAKYLFNFFPDSNEVVLRKIQQLYRDSIGVRPAVHSSNRYWLGRALLRQGKASKGVALIEQAYQEFNRMEWNEMEEFTGRGLLDAYVSLGMGDRILRLYPRYIASRDSLEAKSKLLYTAAANVRYGTERKEQENRALVAEIHLKQRTLTYTWVVVVLLFLLLGGGLAYVLQSRRHYRRESCLHHERISRLISLHQELNRRCESLNGELEKGIHQDVIDNVRQQLNPMLLSGEDEIRFRQSFAALYPSYLPTLRRVCPELTRNDELLCMLILLNQSTDEAALALGISRASVNSGRSRIRKKLGLGKDESLEAYLQGIKKH